MTVVYHPKFVLDIQRFATKYAGISPALEMKFHRAVKVALTMVKANPTSAGHFINTGSLILREVRRHNLKSFPFFVLYGLADDRLIFGSLIPDASDPLTWLTRFN